MLGIFIARFLPGFRAVVAPFAGLAALGPARALVPMALASAVWYGAITVAATALGAEWSRIELVLQRLNRSLAAAGAVAAVAVIVWLVIRRRRRARQPLWTALHGAFDVTGDEASRAAALLLLEVAYADPSLTGEERQAVADRLRARWELPAVKHEPPAGEAHPERSRLAAYRERIAQRFGAERRIALVERIWQVALAGSPAGPGDRLVARAAELIGLSADEVDAARERATTMTREP